MLSQNYWESRYKLGSTSGIGSTGKVRDWKWRIIKNYLTQVDDVIDIGCGDLSFWDGKNCKHYVGVDISETILERNRKSRLNWNFILADASTPLQIRGRIVFCFDLLFHIIDDFSYNRIIENIATYTNEWLFVFTWRKNPFTSYRKILQDAFAKRDAREIIRSPLKWLKALLFKKNSDEAYQIFRQLEKEFHRFESKGLILVAFHGCPYNAGIGGMYVFRKNLNREKDESQ